MYTSGIQELFKIILQLKAQGISILFVSHKLDEVFGISEKYTVFRSGKLIASGNTADLDNKKFIYYMIGKQFDVKTFKPGKLTKEPVLEVHNLSLEEHYMNINFEVRGGEMLGITGLLDSGRTELALSLFGIRPFDRGVIKIHGKAAVVKSPQDAINNAKCQEEIKTWVEELAIATPDPNNAASTLSGGNQQRIVLAKWLACNPDILILNGSTVGVDIGSKHDIHAVLQKLANKGMAVIIISDDLTEVLENCSRVIILKNGEMAGELETGEATEKMILDRMM